MELKPNHINLYKYYALTELKNKADKPQSGKIFIEDIGAP